MISASLAYKHVSRELYMVPKDTQRMTEFVEPLSSELWFERLELVASGEMESVENAL